MNMAPHRASYDADGNIVLPTEAVREESIREPQQSSAPRAEPVVHKQLSSLAIVTRGALHEGLRQVTTLPKISESVTQIERETASLVPRLRAFLTQPVWVPGRNNSSKRYNRTSLFFLDIFRFGGTFAIVFSILFLGLNYQSFWDIVSAKIQPLFSSPSIQISTDDTNAMLVPTDQPMQRSAGNLISFLPPVGPPSDRVVIPKLHLNVPLVTPSYAALLKEDWGQVEKDIQAGLQQGIVHYPGTARPGQAGNFFITGHSSYYPWDPGKYKTVFARLNELQIGDEYSVYYHGDEHRYRVESKKEVKPSDVSVLDQPTDKRISTMMTCTPVGTTLRRLIVVSQEVDPITDEPLKVGEHTVQQGKAAPLQALPI